LIERVALVTEIMLYGALSAILTWLEGIEGENTRSWVRGSVCIMTRSAVSSDQNGRAIL